MLFAPRHNGDVVVNVLVGFGLTVTGKVVGVEVQPYWLTVSETLGVPAVFQFTWKGPCPDAGVALPPPKFQV